MLTNHLPPSTAPTSPRGECELFKLLFQQHASGIYRLANAQLRSRAEAQEIVQECFLKFWVKRHEVSPNPSAIKGYLYTSAYHTILNQVRRRQRWVYAALPDNLLVEAEPQLVELEYQELNVCYTHALARLPSKRREIFVLSRQQGLSNVQIAQKLDLSIKTVEAQMTQALKFIRQYFVLRGVLPGVAAGLVGVLV